MSIPRLASAVAALALVPAGPAAAAPPWSPPLTITAGIPQISQPTIGFGSSGRAVLSARLSTQAQGVPSHGFTRLFGQQPDGSFAGRARLVLAAPPAPYGSTRLALLRVPLAKGDETIKGLDRPDATSLGYTYGRSGGALEVDVGAYHRLTTRADRHSAAIAANPRGDVIAVWVEHLGGRDHLVAAVRRAGGAFGRPAVLAGSGYVTSPAVAVGGNGDLLVSYQRSVPRRGHAPDRRVEARVRRAGHSWGAPQRLGDSTGFSDISAAAAPDGRMVVAWGTQDIGEEANTPWIVRAAIRDGGPHVFHSARGLETSEGIERPAGRVAASIGRDGVVTVAWSGIVGTRYPHLFPARAATAPAGDFRFAAIQTLAPSAAVGDVVTTADGAAFVVWATLPEVGNNQTSDQVFASVRPAGAPAFSATEEVGPAERATLPRAAVDPLTQRPAVVWVARPQAGSQLLRFAARTG
ncbi:MAG: hypothetical protein QOI11_682 [Candidatus Eremiobacteraeota bacterium]|nr:hypothetical protein [Candidatus Eremiobacteraeota bacterium]